MHRWQSGGNRPSVCAGREIISYTSTASFHCVTFATQEQDLLCRKIIDRLSCEESVFSSSLLLLTVLSTNNSNYQFVIKTKFPLISTKRREEKIDSVSTLEVKCWRHFCSEVGLSSFWITRINLFFIAIFFKDIFFFMLNKKKKIIISLMTDIFLFICHYYFSYVRNFVRIVNNI